MSHNARRSGILEKTAEDLLSFHPLIFRGIRRKLIERTISDLELNLTPHSFEIMRLLDSKEKLHIAEIGEKLQIARAQMTQLIDRLVEYSLVKRTADKNDRRVMNVTLTPKGTRVLHEHMLRIKAATVEHLSGLTVEELENVSSLLRKLSDIFARL